MDRRKVIAIFSGIVISTLLVGCGAAPRTTVIGVDESTSIVLVGDLVGGQLELSNGFRRTFTKDDVKNSIVDLLSVKDSPEQKLDRITLKVDPGEIDLTYTAPNGKVQQRRLFITPGIVNEVRLN